MTDNTYKKNYKRKVDKSKIPTCDILGVGIAAVNMDWLIEYLVQNIYNLTGDYITVANVHTTVIAYDDSEYCNIQNGGILAIPDGGPLSSIGRKRNYLNMSRTTGPSLMEEVFKISSEKGYRHYFYGSTEDTLEKIQIKLAENYPDIQIVGTYSPPFRQLNKEEDSAIVKQINDAKPDYIWVGLGAPKQEKWMADHQGIVHGLMIGVGAGFDYFANNIKRAPEWMQQSNLEWLFRLIQDPKRLFRRYLYTNTKFIWNALILNK